MSMKKLLSKVGRKSDPKGERGVAGGKKTPTNPLGLSQDYIDRRNDMLIQIGMNLD